MQRVLGFGYLIVFMFILITACSNDDNPVGPEPSDGLNARGCVILQGDVEIVRAEESVSGAFAGHERVQSELLSFYLIDQNGNLYQPTNEDYVLAWDVVDHRIADFVQYKVDGDWNFHLKGFEAGETKVRFKIIGDEFESLNIPIKVAEGSADGLEK